MIKRDYIMDMIEQFTTFIARLMGLKKLNQFLKARQLIGEVYTSKLGVNEDIINSLMYNDLIKIVSDMEDMDIEKCTLLAKLLKEDGKILIEQGKKEKGFNFLLKSLNIFLVIRLKNEYVKKVDFDAEITDVLNEVKLYELLDSTKHLLFKYYENNGDYALAEDILYQLLDAESYSKTIVSEGINFYNRLLDKTKCKLSAGNLPIDEVIEGKKYLISQCIKRNYEI
ncbi:DUF6483 family protein [Clostridiaceae bacterium M8S5]|nr:DUF6483 family protein [Clostridiaceae bacterium M8S5]